MAVILQNQCQGFEVTAEPAQSQIGSGALPSETLPSAALKITVPDKRRPGTALIKLAKAFRCLPIPVIGRIKDDALWFDMRCLEDEKSFIVNLKELTVA